MQTTFMDTKNSDKLLSNHHDPVPSRSVVQRCKLYYYYYSNRVSAEGESIAYLIVTGPAKIRHIFTNYTCSKVGTFLGPYLAMINNFCKLSINSNEFLNNIMF